MSFAEVAPRKLKPRHHRILELDLLGVPTAEIAQRVGLHYQRVCISRYSPAYQAALQEARQRCLQAAADTLALAALAAVHVEIEIMQNPEMPPALRLKACQDILDRVPETSRTLRAHARAPSPFTPEQLARLEHMAHAAKAALEQQALGSSTELSTLGGP